MNTPSLPAQCPDCETPRIIVVHEPLPLQQIERRAFLKKTIGALAATAITPALTPWAQAAKGGRSETLVQQFAKTLTEEQRAKVCFKFDDHKRTLVDNNWHIVDEKLGAFFTKEQQAMVREIFLGLHSPEYAEKVMQQVTHDSGKAGFEDSSVALFGEPGTGKFEFVLPAGTARGAATATASRARHSAARFSTDTPRRAPTRRPTTRATHTGIRPSARTRSSRCSTASSAKRRCSIADARKPATAP